MKRCLVLVVSMMLLPLQALAQTSDSKVANAHTDAHFKEGIAAFDAGRYEEAWVAFKKAYALNPTLYILHNLAFAAVKSERHLEAARLLEPVLPCGDECPDELKKFGQSLLDQANEHLGRLKVRSPVQGARVEVDGEALPAWALSKEFPVLPGSHQVRGYAGDRSDSREVSVGLGQVAEVELDLAEPPAQETQPRPSEGSEGNALTQTETEPAESSSTARTAVVITGGAFTAVALVGAVTLNMSASSARDDARQMKRTLASENVSCAAHVTQECSLLESTAQRASDRKTMANRLLLVSGTLAVASALTWFFWPQPPPASETALNLIPSIGSTNAALVLSGQF